MTDPVTPPSAATADFSELQFGPWSDLRKAFFRIMLEGDKKNYLLKAFTDKLIVLNYPQKQEWIFLAQYNSTEERRKDIEGCLKMVVAPENSGWKVTFILFGGDEEARALLARPATPSRWYKAQIMHVDQQHQVHVVNGRENNYYYKLCSNLDSFEPDNAEVPLYALRCVASKMRDDQYNAEVEQYRKRIAKNKPLASYVILGLLLLYAAVVTFLGGFDITPLMVRLGALVPGLVKEGEWWRLITCGFLHGGFLHLFCNGYCLYILGSQLERIIGSWRFIVLYFASLVAGSLASCFFMKAGYSLGASGALWGLMGAEAVLLFLPRGLLPHSLAMAARRNVIWCLILNLAISFAPGIDMSAHLGGGLMGAALMASGLLTIGINKRLADSVYNILALVLVALMAAGLVFGVEQGEVWNLRKAPLLVKTTAFNHEINLPSAGRQGAQKDQETERGLVIGDILTDSGVYELKTNPLPEEIPLDSLIPKLQIPQPYKTIVKPQIYTVGGRKVLTVKYAAPNDLVYRRDFWYYDGLLWNSELLVWKSYEEYYRGLPERIIESVK